ncbi:hypothetical protein [Allobaculum sp. JKK-2023]|uniref:hypothetical protein n=1 Tax=Allobaculum sp. JKK-2023 TaxID=3108943 RepID=UPI002B0548E3|nr:hypothetical protein [Allobaculum sp. JKK-2023]
MKKTKRSESRKNSHLTKTGKILTSVFVLCALFFCATRLILNSYANDLSVSNKELTDEISQRSTAIEQLKSDIAQLEEKSRVLGMLEGQVSEDANRVYYYGENQ